MTLKATVVSYFSFDSDVFFKTRIPVLIVRYNSLVKI